MNPRFAKNFISRSHRRKYRWNPSQFVPRWRSSLWALSISSARSCFASRFPGSPSIYIHVKNTIACIVTQRTKKSKNITTPLFWYEKTIASFDFSLFFHTMAPHQMSRISKISKPRWWNGRHERLKISWQQCREGSIPSPGTKIHETTHVKTWVFLTCKRLKKNLTHNSLVIVWLGWSFLYNDSLFVRSCLCSEIIYQYTIHPHSHENHCFFFGCIIFSRRCFCRFFGYRILLV